MQSTFTPPHSADEGRAALPDPLPACADRENLDLALRQHLGISSTALFCDTCNRMELDREWLTAAARTDTTLLFRYFGHLARRMKDLLEYRDLLGECLRAVSVEIPCRSMQLH